MNKSFESFGLDKTLATITYSFAGKCKHLYSLLIFLIWRNTAILFLFFVILNLEVKPVFKFNTKHISKALNVLICGRILEEVCEEDVTRSG